MNTSSPVQRRRRRTLNESPGEQVPFDFPDRFPAVLVLSYLCPSMSTPRWGFFVLFFLGVFFGSWFFPEHALHRALMVSRWV